MVSQSLVQDSVVVWVGNFPYDENPADVLNSSSASQPTPENAPAPEAGAAPTPVPPPDKIALAVSPQDAVTINYVLQSNGKLTLALRSASETPNLSTDAVTLQYLLDKYSIPYPAKLPYGVQFGQSDPPPAAAAAAPQ
jgi:pilus assembly protein CpaB